MNIQLNLIRVIWHVVIIFLLISCNQKQPTATDSTSDFSKEDSLAFVNRKDSLERELVFEALGDTAFGNICFGVNETQYLKALNAFKRPLIKESRYFDIEFADYKFHIDEGSHVEKNKNVSIQGWPYGLEDILKEDRMRTYFYNNKLFSINWNSSRRIGDYSSVKKQIEYLVSYFEKRYGKPNVNNIALFNSSYIETGVWFQMKVIAKWDTNNRKIVIYYRELVGNERDKWMDENYPNEYQYELDINFIDKAQKRDVDNYIKPILKRFSDDYIEKERRDSIKNENVL